MDLIGERSVLRQRLESARHKGERVGLVPTMGSLHGGHLSLVGKARQDCDYVAVSIFVNPTQFGDVSDFEAYPRDLGADLHELKAAGVDVVFAPSVAEMYPGDGLDTSVVPGALASVLEGPRRPGHLTAVATVVTKLFAIAGACSAYFGEKDYQQLAVVRRLAADLDLPVEVVGCPTVREPDGLAMSSRNRRLDGPGRRAATALFRALSTGSDLVAGGERRGAAVAGAMQGVLASEALVQPEYAAVADPSGLGEVTDIDGEVRLLVAARVEPVRLIDNMAAKPPAEAGPDVQVDHSRGVG